MKAEEKVFQDVCTRCPKKALVGLGEVVVGTLQRVEFHVSAGLNTAQAKVQSSYTLCCVSEHGDHSKQMYPDIRFGS